MDSCKPIQGVVKATKLYLIFFCEWFFKFPNFLINIEIILLCKSDKNSDWNNVVVKE